MAMKTRHILLTGSPGVGKTTLVRRICDKLQKLNEFTISGFYTSEIRCPKSGVRTGFELITIPENERTYLATVDPKTASSLSKRTANLGKYTILLDCFEPLILKSLAQYSTSKLMIVDEIGKMECFSKSFCDEIDKLFDRDCIVFGTIPFDKSGHVSRLPTVEKIKKRNDVKIVIVTGENRDKLVEELTEMIKMLCLVK